MVNKCVLSQFSSQMANVKAKFDTSFVEARFNQELLAILQKKAGKKGFVLETGVYSPAPQDFVISGEITRIDAGNRLVRYLTLFGGRAVVEVYGQVTMAGVKISDIHYTAKTTSYGRFGGSSKRLLRKGAKLAAKKIAKQILKALEQPPVQQPPVQVAKRIEGASLGFREVVSGSLLDFRFDSVKVFGRNDFEAWLKSGLLISADLNHISRKHFMIREKNGSLFISDMNSSNGTKLNGTILKPGAESQLRNGDILSFGLGDRSLEIEVTTN